MPPNVICVCPIRNEAAQLDRFLSCASLWATHVIVADQGSTDGSREIASRYPKVRVIDNPCKHYNESERQKMLIDAARQIAGPRLIVALDADELMTANILVSEEWSAALSSPPGTALFFDWVNLLPGHMKGWIFDTRLPWGYVDDGRPHVGRSIHSPRVPFAKSGRRLKLKEVKVLHYQYINWIVMKRKQMWYQCWETVHSPHLSPIDIFRRYHHMDAVAEADCVDTREEWFAGYERAGIAVRTSLDMATDKWDQLILDLLLEHGAQRFRRVDMWSVDWASRLRELRPNECSRSAELSDPRNGIDRAVMILLNRGQKKNLSSASRKAGRALIRRFGW